VAPTALSKRAGAVDLLTISRCPLGNP
jgi:hypothetical protein